MQPASSGVIRAASPSAFTLARLAAAVAAARAAERIRHACAAVDDAAARAEQAHRDLLTTRSSPKVRAAREAAAAASDAAAQVADATAAALGREDAEDAERAALCALARATFADRLAALAAGPLWAGSGYCDALADATRSISVATPRVVVPALGAEEDALAHVVVETNAWSAEPYAFHVVALTPSRGAFDAYSVSVPEVRDYVDVPERAPIRLGLTSTTLEAADARPLAEAANVAAAVVAVVERYVAAHPAETAMTEAKRALRDAYATAYGEPLSDVE